jgi:hypothetical protein
MAQMLLGLLTLILAPPLLGAALGLVQFAGYRLLIAMGAVKRDDVPPFFVLWLRGLAAVIAIAAAIAIWTQLLQGPPQAAASGGLPG